MVIHDAKMMLSARITWWDVTAYDFLLHYIVRFQLLPLRLFFKDLTFLGMEGDIQQLIRVCKLVDHPIGLR